MEDRTVSLLPVFLVFAALGASFQSARAAIVPGDLLLINDLPTTSTLIQVNNGCAQTAHPLSTVLAGPSAITIGLLGELYVAEPRIGDPAGARILKVNTLTGEATTLTQGGDLVRPGGMATAADGSIYVTDYGALGNQGAIIRVDVNDGTQTIVHPGIRSFHNIAISNSGNILTVDDANGGNAVVINPITHAVTPLPNQEICRAVAVDGEGFLLVLGRGQASSMYTLIRVHPLTGDFTVSDVGFLGFLPDRMIVGSAGEIYISDNDFSGSSYSGVVYKVPPGGGLATVCTFGQHLGFNSPHLAVYGVRNGAVPALPVSWGQLKAAYR